LRDDDVCPAARVGDGDGECVRGGVAQDPEAAHRCWDLIRDVGHQRARDRQDEILVLGDAQGACAGRETESRSAAERRVNDVQVGVDRDVPRIDVVAVAGQLKVLVRAESACHPQILSFATLRAFTIVLSS